MKQGIYSVGENTRLTPTIYRMKLAGDISAIRAAGQFVNIKLEGHFLRRPISICDVEASEGSNGTLTIIYKVLGRGTEEMKRIKAGSLLDVLTGLGNGYDLSKSGERPLLIGGGVGIPPLYLAAKILTKREHDVNVILGFGSAGEAYYIEEFEALGCRVAVASVDGSIGTRGFVTDAFKEIKDDAEFTQFYACGPEPMLRAVYKEVHENAGIDGQLSFEERMGCGFGACMGCSIKTLKGNKRVCKDGPVLYTDEILW